MLQRKDTRAPTFENFSQLPPAALTTGGKGDYDSGHTGDEEKEKNPSRPQPMWNGPGGSSQMSASY